MNLEALAGRLSRRIAGTRRAGAEPLAVLDVDLTLIDNAPRTRAIFADWMHTLRGRWDGADAGMVAAQTMPITFGVVENLRTLGVTEPELVREGVRFWAKCFFTSEYTRHDHALPGAVDFVRALTGRGVAVAYLTARPSSMAPGTVELFARLGFPVGEVGTFLVMKDDPEEADDHYKRRALEWIERIGRPVLCADNEPGHVNAMLERFPKAVCVQVGDRHSGGAPPLAEGAVRLPRLKDLMEAWTDDEVDDAVEP